MVSTVHNKWSGETTFDYWFNQTAWQELNDGRKIT